MLRCFHTQGFELKLPALVREPLVHFLLIGFALFVLYGRVASDNADSRRIEVSNQQIDALSRQFMAYWNRAPTQEELVGLINAHIRNEVLYREGVAMGMEAEDPVIKRRIRQKIEVMAEESGSQVAPTDAELSEYLARNSEKFRLPTVVSFEQVFFAEDSAAANLGAEIDAALIALRAGEPASSVGQAGMLPAALVNASMDAVISEFGAAFAKPLERIPLDAWHGPIASSFGTHLVRVSKRTYAAVPELAQVRPQVLREWENARRERNRTEAYRAMAKNYHIVFEGKSLAADQKP